MIHRDLKELLEFRIFPNWSFTHSWTKYWMTSLMRFTFLLWGWGLEKGKGDGRLFVGAGAGIKCLPLWGKYEKSGNTFIHLSPVVWAAFTNSWNVFNCRQTIDFKGAEDIWNHNGLWCTVLLFLFLETKDDSRLGPPPFHLEAYGTTVNSHQAACSKHESPRGNQQEIEDFKRCVGWCNICFNRLVILWSYLLWWINFLIFFTAFTS